MSLLLVGLLACALEAEEFPQWAHLTPGPHAVGFRVLPHLDHGRAYAGGSDLAGRRLDAAPKARPLPISIWYPAAAAGAATRMRFRDYVHLRAAEDDLQPLSDERRRLAERWFVGYSGAPGATPAQIAGVFALDSRAVAEADPLPGPFPLVLYAPGYSEGSHENTLLAEHLASHGFVTAMTPMRGLLARHDRDAMTGIEAQVQDLGSLLGELRRRPYVDADRLAVAGFDEGGLAAVLFALRHAGADAAISLDGVMGYRDAEAAARFPYFDGARMTVPYLELVAGAKKRDRDPARFQPAFSPAMRGATALTLRFERMAHDDFTSDHLVNYVHTGRDEQTFAVADIDRSYALLCRYVLWFLQAHVAGDEAARARLAQAPANDGVPPGWVTVLRR